MKINVAEIRADDLRGFLSQGGFPVRTQAGIAEALGVTAQCVHTYLREMAQEVGKRYPEGVIAQPSRNLVLVSTAAFWDYLCFRQRLRDPRQRAGVPEYDPTKTLDSLGVSFTLVA